MVWLFATMLFVGGVTTAGIILWQTRATNRQHEVRERLVAVHPARHWRVVTPPPYNYDVDGE